MALFSWAKPAPLSIEKNLPANTRIYFISDLHLGDGTRSDIFMGKDTQLMKLLDQIRTEKAHLVIAGDAIDFHQAWSISRVIKAHARLMRALSEVADDTGVTYIWGNHDYDISLFRDLLQFDVCSVLTLDNVVKIQHGYEYDPFIGPKLAQTHVATRIHHMIERLLDTWIRLPLENFYTIENRIAFWIFHKFALLNRSKDQLLQKLNMQKETSSTAKIIQHWTMNQIADPAGIFRNVHQTMLDEDFTYLLTGHSHLPGIIQIDTKKTYVNTGSWTFNSAQYAIWDGNSFSVHDWLSGKRYGDHAYRALAERRYEHMDFFAWWRENYLGWLRYRVGEHGRIPQPQSWIKDTNNAS